MKQNAVLRYIAYRVLEGPAALYPASGTDGWYERETFIQRALVETKANMMVVNGYESVSIWTDGTPNRERDFLEPVIRYARWDLAADMTETCSEKEREWPTVELVLGSIGNPGNLDHRVSGFHELLQSLPFVPGCIGFRQEEPDMESDSQYSPYKIWMTNGVQCLEFSGYPLRGEGFTREVFRFFDEIKTQMVIINKTGWKEKYDKDLSAPSIAEYWSRELS